VQSCDVPELAQGDQSGDLAHPVLGHERLATGLAARERAQVPLNRGDLNLEQIDDLQRHADPLPRVDGQLQAGEEPAACQGPQIVGAPAMPW